MWPFLTLSTSFSCRAFKAWPKKTLTCISWYRQRRPIFASFKMAPIHNRLANVVRKGTQRPASSYAVPVRSVMVTSRSVSVVVSSLWVCSTGRGWMASECFSAVLNMRDLQENMLFNLQKHMGNVSTVCLCELTDLIKKSHHCLWLYSTYLSYFCRNSNVSHFKLSCAPAETDKVSFSTAKDYELIGFNIWKCHPCVLILHKREYLS